MTLFRLPTDRAEALRWFFCDAEGACGLRSNAGAVMSILEMGLFASEASRRAVDVMPDRAEKARRDAWRTHQCLQRMQRDEGGIRFAGILWRVYGPHHWRMPFGHFEALLAPIVEDTPIIAAMLLRDTELTKAGAIDQIIRGAKKGGGPVVLRRLEAQASEMLSGASLAYNTAWERERADRDVAKVRAEEVWRAGLMRCAS